MNDTVKANTSSPLPRQSSNGILYLSNKIFSCRENLLLRTGMCIQFGTLNIDMGPFQGSKITYQYKSSRLQVHVSSLVLGASAML